MADSSHLKIIRSTAAAATMINAQRLRLLEELAEPASAAELSRRLGAPRQQIYYHLKELEEAGFLELLEARKQGNCTERVLRLTARSFLIAPDALGMVGRRALDPDESDASAYLAGVAALVINEMGLREADARRGNGKLPVISFKTDMVFESVEAHARFVNELAEQVSNLVAKYMSKPGGKGIRYTLFAGGFQKSGKED